MMAFPSMRLFGLGSSAQDAFVDELRRADARAITRVYREHAEAVRRFAWRLTGDREIAEDVVQDVFVELPSAMARFREEGSFRSFLFAIGANLARKHVRRAALSRRKVKELGDAPPPSSPQRPDQEASRRQLAERLRDALESIPYEQRMAFVLMELEEITSREAALIVDAPEGTVRARAMLARKKLRELLEGEGVPS